MVPAKPKELQHQTPTTMAQFNQFHTVDRGWCQCLTTKDVDKQHCSLMLNMLHMLHNEL